MQHYEEGVCVGRSEAQTEGIDSGKIGGFLKTVPFKELMRRAAGTGTVGSEDLMRLKPRHPPKNLFCDQANYRAQVSEEGNNSLRRLKFGTESKIESYFSGELTESHDKEIILSSKFEQSQQVYFSFVKCAQSRLSAELCAFLRTSLRARCVRRKRFRIPMKRVSMNESLSPRTQRFQRLQFFCSPTEEMRL